MIRERVRRLLERLPTEPQYATQGATLFVDLAQQQIQSAYTPRPIVETFLEGRGANMFYLINLLDPGLEPLHPDIPLQLATGLLTGIVPSAARGQVTGWSPESRVLMDSSAGDFVPSFMKLQGIDRFVLYGQAPGWTYLHVEDGVVEFRDAAPYVGLDNLALRERLATELDGRWGRDLAMANITRAGEHGVAMAAIMGGLKALWARGGSGAKMGSLRLKAIVLRGFSARRGAGHHAAEVKPANRAIAKQVLSTSVVKHALSVRGTPFLYKPSRLLGAMGTRNNQDTAWTEALDAEHIDPFRTGMTGCFRCPVKCRPSVDLGRTPDDAAEDPYVVGEGPEYVTVGKLGAAVGIDDLLSVLRLNNVVNDLGLDAASVGSTMAWTMELYQRGIITEQDTGGLQLRWGDADLVAQLLEQTATRTGFGDVIAEGANAVDRGKLPPEAERYCMAVKRLMQSDPHDARILKAFALGLAVATRGMDHLRNRATLEINARINDDPDYKARLYGGPVSAAPTSYQGKELAVRTCEDQFAVGDALGMCRFTTKLFNSPNLPGYQELSPQIENVTGLELSPAELERCGRNITGLERMINHSLGVGREHDTLPRRWFDEPVPQGPHAGERIDRAEFDAMLHRFYELSGLDETGQPRLAWRAELARAALGFAIEVRLPPSLLTLPEGGLLITEPVRSVGELLDEMERRLPAVAELRSQSGLSVVINDEVLLSDAEPRAVQSGDRIELIPLAGGG